MFVFFWIPLLLLRGGPKHLWRLFFTNGLASTKEPRKIESLARLRLILGGSWNIRFAKASAPSPILGKEGFGVKPTPISQCPRNGRFESKNPQFSTGPHKENGDFLTQSAHFWDTRKWEFFDPETLFSRFWRFWPLCGADAFAKSENINNWMRLFCLQLEASCLQWSLFTYSWQL